MRLIDADKLVPDTEYDDYGDGAGTEYLSYSAKQIREAPTVCGSCRDCRCCDTNEQGSYCDYLGDWTDADWFCANWEAKYEVDTND